VTKAKETPSLREREASHFYRAKKKKSCRLYKVGKIVSSLERGEPARLDYGSAKDRKESMISICDTREEVEQDSTLLEKKRPRKQARVPREESRRGERWEK